MLGLRLLWRGSSECAVALFLLTSIFAWVTARCFVVRQLPGAGGDGHHRHILAATRQPSPLEPGRRVLDLESGCLATVVEKRRGGWWRVELDEGGEISVRTSQLSLLPTALDAGEGGCSSGGGAKDPKFCKEVIVGAGDVVLPTLPPPPSSSGNNSTEVLASNTILDLSSSGLPHADVKRWVIFSDLHVGPASLNSCLATLERVAQEVQGRNQCGAIFLGDFWNLRGAVRVDLLNSVMRALSLWDFPVIMIPGNHDQMTMSGLEHALSPLQYALGGEQRAVIASLPTLFLDALWIPHVRNATDMEAILASPKSKSARAIFCHADVWGASMNDGISSRSSVAVTSFPGSLPVYSGHFHKPHIVRRGTSAVHYVGSPYQTSLGEAGQDKELLVINSETFQVEERIKLNIGRRYFKVKGTAEALPQASPGDRVVWSVDDTSCSKVLEIARQLQSKRIEVELRTSLPNKDTSSGLDGSLQGRDTNSSQRPETTASESLSPHTLLSKYLDEFKSNNDTQLHQEGKRLLDLILREQAAGNGTLPSGSSRLVSSGGQGRVDLQLHQVRLKRFGPFRGEIVYPLRDRGVVFLRGNNMDDTGADSNGAGKTTLAASIIWALTGSLDARPGGDGSSQDVVYDIGSESNRGRLGAAEVELEATLNGERLCVVRRRGARLNQLHVSLGGKDLTLQGIRETQELLEAKLGINTRALVRAVFQGQHHMNRLLESTDARMKEELSLLLPMNHWQDAASRSRTRVKEAEISMAQIDAKLSLRLADEHHLSKQVNATEDALARCREALEERNRQVVDGFEIDQLKDSILHYESELGLVQKSADEAASRLAEKRAEYEEMRSKRVQERYEVVSKTSKLAERVKPLRQKVGSLEKLLQDQTAVSDPASESITAEESNKAKDFEASENEIKRKIEGGRIALARAQAEALQSRSEVEAHGSSAGDLCSTCGQEITPEYAASRMVELKLLQESKERLVSVAESELEALLCELEKTRNLKDFVQQRDRMLRCQVDLDQAQNELRQCEEKLVEAQEHLDSVDECERLADEQGKSAMQELEATLRHHLEARHALQDALTSDRAKLADLMLLLQAQEAEEQSLVRAVQSAEKAHSDALRAADGVQTEVHQLQSERSLAEQDRSVYSQLSEVFGLRGVQNFVFRESVAQLENIVSRYLDMLSDGALKLGLSLEGDRVVKSILLRVSGGKMQSRSLRQLSGGQWRRVSIALELAFTEFAKQRSQFSCNLLVMDEILNQLDAHGRARVSSLLRRVVHGTTDFHGLETTLDRERKRGTCLVILQDMPADALTDLFDQVDEVVRTGDESTVDVDSSAWVS